MPTATKVKRKARPQTGPKGPVYIIISKTTRGGELAACQSQALRRGEDQHCVVVRRYRVAVDCPLFADLLKFYQGHFYVVAPATDDDGVLFGRVHGLLRFVMSGV